MKFSAASVLLVGSASAFTGSSPYQTARGNTALSETKADLQGLAKDLNPLVGYFDPLGLTDAAFWGQSDDFTIGFLRQAEVKHGRVAMAALLDTVCRATLSSHGR